MVVADIFQCPENVIGHEPQDWAFYLPWAFALQLAILFAQDRLGPAFFIPRSVRYHLLARPTLLIFKVSVEHIECVRLLPVTPGARSRSTRTVARRLCHLHGRDTPSVNRIDTVARQT